MAIRIKVDLKGIQGKLGPQAMIRARMTMASQMLLDMTNYVPLAPDGGDLRASGHVTPNGRAIEWLSVYARAQFYGTNGIVKFRRYSTPGTGKRWDLKATPLHIDEWKRKFVEGSGLQ